MYKHSQLIDRSNGLDCYEVDPKYFDPILHKKANEAYDIECNCNAFPTKYDKPKKVRPRTSVSKKPVPDKNIIYNMVKKHPRQVPGPWQYNVFPKWLTSGTYATPVSQASLQCFKI